MGAVPTGNFGDNSEGYIKPSLKVEASKPLYEPDSGMIRGNNNKKWIQIKPGKVDCGNTGTNFGFDD